MKSFDQLVAEIDGLTADVLRGWVDRGWVRAVARQAPPAFADIDVARVRMLCDFHLAMDIDEETLPVLLDLVDQVHGLRLQLRAVSRAVAEMPAATRDDIRRRVVRELGGDADIPSTPG